MCYEERRPCISGLILLSVALAVIATFVAIVISRQNERRLLEKEEDEKDSDIKECGC
jgi:uncharacterized protein YpmS